jgi:hypothetical protein
MNRRAKRISLFSWAYGLGLVFFVGFVVVNLILDGMQSQTGRQTLLGWAVIGVSVWLWNRWKGGSKGARPGSHP